MRALCGLNTVTGARRAGSRMRHCTRSATACEQPSHASHLPVAAPGQALCLRAVSEAAAAGPGVLLEFGHAQSSASVQLHACTAQLRCPVFALLTPVVRGCDAACLVFQGRAHADEVPRRGRQRALGRCAGYLGRTTCMSQALCMCPRGTPRLCFRDASPCCPRRTCTAQQAKCAAETLPHVHASSPARSGSPLHARAACSRARPPAQARGWRRRRWSARRSARPRPTRG
jgi:hypothetical protein